MLLHGLQAVIGNKNLDEREMGRLHFWVFKGF